MDKQVLGKFLKAGFLHKDKFHPTDKGAPQGGIISPALTVLALSGLERAILPPTRGQKQREKINVVAYADDFIITAATAELLTQKVMPNLVTFLKTVGLELSSKKTKITTIEEGFDFLGFNIRKYKNGKVFTKPSKASINTFCKKIRDTVKKAVALPTDKLIHTLNQKITGWTNYYRCVVSSKVFCLIDDEIFHALKRWSFKRHPTKGRRWIMKQYYTSYRGSNWRFHCVIKDKTGEKRPLYLKKASDTKIRRHMKIIACATPFDPAYKDYFEKREKERKRRNLLGNNAELTGLKIIQSY